jgi:hypothetical protein
MPATNISMPPVGIHSRYHLNGGRHNFDQRFSGFSFSVGSDMPYPSWIMLGAGSGFTPADMRPVLQVWDLHEQDFCTRSI